jgi:hypothetical protein
VDEEMDHRNIIQAEGQAFDLAQEFVGGTGQEGAA